MHLQTTSSNSIRNIKQFGRRITTSARNTRSQKEAITKDEKQEETDALAAQRRAIQSETSSNLADESPQAQEIQEAKKKQLLKMKNKKKQMHLQAQRRAIQSETSSNLADESPQAQEIQEAKKKQLQR